MQCLGSIGRIAAPRGVRCEGGDIADEGFVSADEDGLAKLVLRLGSDAVDAVW